MSELLLTVKREKPTESVCRGQLFVNHTFRFYTLEDPPRAIKIPDVTGIPAGFYKLRLTYSPRFQRDLPEVVGVPGFTGIRIHPGNTAGDTSGCLLVGDGRTGSRLLRSRYASDAITETLRQHGRDAWIDIWDAF